MSPGRNSCSPRSTMRTYFAKDYRIPQLITWTARIERQLVNNWVRSVAYLGNKATYLQYTISENPAIFRPGATVGNTQDRRLYPNFGPVSRYDAGGNSTYHSLQWNLEKRFVHGYSILANYTWSKNIDDLSAVNPFNRTVSRGVSSFDVPHNFKFSNLWYIPSVK